MKGWDRLLAREFLPILFQGVGVFSLLVAFAIYFRVVIKMITDYEIGLATVGQFLLLGLPQAVAIAIPMAVLFASLMAFSRLSERGEIRALLTCGLSLRRLFAHVGLVGLLASFLAIILNESVIPNMVTRMENLKQEMFQEGRLGGEDVMVRGTYPSGNLRYLLFADKFEGEILYQVQVFLFTDNEVRERERDLTARRGEFAGDGIWQLEDVVVYTYLPDDRVATMRQDTLDLALGESPVQIGRLRSRDVQEMTFGECSDHVDELRLRGESARWRKQGTQCQMKLAVPFATFIFALIGATMGCSWARAGNTGMGLGVAIVVILFYYMLMMLSIGLGKSGVDPVAAAWMPDIVLYAVALYLGWRRDNPNLAR